MTWTKIKDNLINLERVDVIRVGERDRDYTESFLIEVFFSGSDDDECATLAFKSEDERNAVFSHLADMLNAKSEAEVSAYTKCMREIREERINHNISIINKMANK
jgi:hypothetical protein